MEEVRSAPGVVQVQVVAQERLALAVEAELQALEVVRKSQA